MATDGIAQSGPDRAATRQQPRHTWGPVVWCARSCDACDRRSRPPLCGCRSMAASPATTGWTSGAESLNGWSDRMNTIREPPS
jgi:hypothetical protein